jgi:hypothetical protein
MFINYSFVHVWWVVALLACNQASLCWLDIKNNVE